ncbi:glutamate decarboxylase [Actinotalea sp. M2MS4P-6]|uniref:glutamate decarboxylase n=1 Tax=Actinotalea sp. M2MS4P-6 TaxID=2983762 RepID=UPI0021E3C9A6|nr:glutamate decarboxylase [Actinotalea sp. M2MS4P-6]MCV2394760.1 glutamate decarboxylase [Actinotalea sp. M2MS4P-6]
MVHRHEHDDSTLYPAYAGRLSGGPIPKNRMPDDESAPESVYRLIHDELLLDGSSRLNLATFVTTWMEPQAQLLMAEAFDKNMIDKDEYPQTAEIERRCVNIVADLFHAPVDGDAIGVSTIGSSEAVMLGGLAMKWRWRQRREAAGLPTDRPNLVLGSNVQVVWEKFCRYWDVEPRYVPVSHDRFVVAPDDVMARVDENTIGVIPILGTTYTGEFEPIKEIHDRVVAWNTEHGADVPLHVDAASGGFVAPFLHPDLEWDFRLPQVKSINVSGHKYGLTYPGVGFVVWRSADELPEDLVFHVNYLGGDMPTFTLNFSRPGNQIVGQYYNFVRLGRDGYRRIMERLRDVAHRLADRIGAMDAFELVSDGTDIPVLAFRTSEFAPFTVFHVSDELRKSGWQVPAYTMPADATDVAVLRVVVREGFTFDLADLLAETLEKAVRHLTEYPPDGFSPQAGFSHT